MSKCLFKALKAVNLEQHLGLFRSLGYDSAGALTHFRAEDFEKLKFNEQELLRLISLLDMLKDGRLEGKICSHSQDARQTKRPSPSLRANWCDETSEQRNKVKSSNDRNGIRRTTTSLGFATGTNRSNYLNEMIFQRPSTVISRSPRQNPSKRIFSGKPFLNRPAVQHIKVKSYNYGVPTHRRVQRGHYHSSIFVSSPRAGHEGLAFGKPAEIFVYARKRPMLSSESNLQDSITCPDHQRIVVAENKANLDCSPMVKRSEFQFDQVFSADASNRIVFEQTVLPFLSSPQRSNLTYICFGQTGSGKSHTIFGSRTNDGLLVFCTQLLLQEIDEHQELICSFYEIYNNQVYDLNHPGKKLFVREDGNHHVNIIGITELVVRNVETLRRMIDEGLNRRHHGKSAFNSNSSRSHAVFQIAVRNDDQSNENFRLIFIDLAGSERATDAQNNQRQTRREGAQINSSLLALKECIRSMDLTHSHAPFRQSKLTHILRDSLIGAKSRTCLMANVSPANDCCQCSLNTLQYASRIREISMRHRHRSMPMNSIRMDLIDENIRESKVQSTFKPATASTPIHRLVSSVDPPVYVSMQPKQSETRPTKTIDIDWQLADDDPPISKSGENLLRVNPSRQPNRKKMSNDGPSTSSALKRPFNSLKLMFDNGNDRQEKRRYPVRSAVTSNGPRPVAQVSQSTPAMTKETVERREVKKRELLRDSQSNHHHHHRTNGSGKETHDFLSNRENLLNIVSERLTRSTSVATPRDTSKPNSRRNSQVSINKPRILKSSSSSTTSFVNTNGNQKKKGTTMIYPKADSNLRRSNDRRGQDSKPSSGPLRVQHKPNTNDIARLCEDQLIIETTRKTENLFTPSSTPMPATDASPILEPTSSRQRPLDQIKAMSPFVAATLNNPWLMSPSFPSPSKEFGLRVSEQLMALRNLLETRLNEQEEDKSRKNSPTKFHRIDVNKYDDDDDEVARSFNHQNPSSSALSSDGKENPLKFHPVTHQTSLSSLSNELNQARVSTSLTSSINSTINSNLAAKIETHERQILSSPLDRNGIHSYPNDQASKLNVGTSRSTSFPTSETEEISSNTIGQNRSEFSSPILLPPFSKMNLADTMKDVHDHLQDSGQGTSLFTGSSFETLMNSLKTLREKALDFPVRSTDEQLIPVAE